MKLAFLGLGKMGNRMVSKLLAGGHEIVVWNRSSDVTQTFLTQHKEFVKANKLSSVVEIKDFSSLLDVEIFWSMVPPGPPTEEVMKSLEVVAKKEDIIIDGGNAYYKDSQRRYENFAKMGARFLGIGVSGGILAIENGFPLMVGGDESAYKEIEPILITLTHPRGGYAYFGVGGVGHFIKMVHNGIEYGMMQSLAEGFGVLEKSPYPLALEKVGMIWQKNTIISSFLLDRAVDALDKDSQLSTLVGEIDATGEAEWTIEAAKEEGVPVPVIEDSLKFRTESKKDVMIKESFVAKMVAAIRREFGGHKVVEK